MRGLWLLATALAMILTWELTPGAISEPAIPAVAVRLGAAPIAGRQEISAALRAREYSKYERTILARPLFAPSRRLSAAATVRSSVAILPRLTGVIIAPGTRLAMFASAEGKHVTATMGATVGGYVVTSIAPAAAMLLGPDGVRQVHIGFSHTTPHARPYEIEPARDAPGSY